ncbi:MAG: hypothetical protein M3Q95_03875 [Bacteroidota bacterium]|nr:hypothetical protein [Bacteroidota bacterium]
MEQFKLFNGLFNWIDRASQQKFYALALTIFLTLSSLFFAFPRYDQYQETAANWEVVMLKSGDLSNDLSHIDPNSWLAKKVFRLTVPLFIKIFHLNRPAVIIVQFLIGLLFLYFTYIFSKRILKDAVAATLFTAALVFLYIGRTCFTEITATWFDGWAYFFLLMALMLPNAVAVFFFAVLAAWVDERAIVILPALILFHQMKNLPSGNTVKELMHFIVLNKKSIAVVAAFVLTMASRMALTAYAGMKTPLDNVSLNTVKDNMFVSGFGIFTFFEGLWLLLPVVLLLAFKNKNYVLIALILVQIAISTAGAIFVYDVTRSGSYMFPLLFVWLTIIAVNMQLTAIRHLLLAAFFFCLVFPPVNFVSQWNLDYATEKPMLFVLFKLFAG